MNNRGIVHARFNGTAQTGGGFTLSPPHPGYDIQLVKDFLKI
jgi:hypothetical protein